MVRAPALQSWKRGAGWGDLAPDVAIPVAALALAHVLGAGHHDLLGAGRVWRPAVGAAAATCELGGEEHVRIKGAARVHTT